MTDDNVEDLEKARCEEWQQRQEMAKGKSKILAEIMLGERVDMGDGYTAMGVVGGWIFYRTHKAGICSTYVPFPAAPPQIKMEIPKIELPNGAKL